MFKKNCAKLYNHKILIMLPISLHTDATYGKRNYPQFKHFRAASRDQTAV